MKITVIRTMSIKKSTDIQYMQIVRGSTFSVMSYNITFYFKGGTILPFKRQFKPTEHSTYFSVDVTFFTVIPKILIKKKKYSRNTMT